MKYCDCCGRSCEKSFFGLCEECYTGDRYEICKRESDRADRENHERHALSQCLDGQSIAKGYLTGAYYFGECL